MKIKSGKMGSLIELVYGASLGVSSFNFFQKINETQSKISTWEKDILYNIILFDSLFFLFTFLIIAHDWYTHHISDFKSEKSFYYYIFDIFSIFFIAQMFASANHKNIIFWYWFGMAYAICNFGNFFLKFILNKSEINFSIELATLLIHLLICCGGIFLIEYNQTTYKHALSIYFGYFFLTAFTVFYLWIINENKSNS